MSEVSAFVGHSFRQGDQALVERILKFLTTVVDLVPGFSWDHAQGAEPKQVSAKVLEKIEGKNLFIGICTASEYIATAEDIRPVYFRPTLGLITRAHLKQRCSEWITQEIGLAIGRKMKIILLLEKGVSPPGGLQGDLEYIEFRREAIADAFDPLAQMIARLRPPAPSSGAAQPATAAPEAATPAGRPVLPEVPAPANEPVDPQVLARGRVFWAASGEKSLTALTEAVTALGELKPVVPPLEVAELHSIALEMLTRHTQVEYLDEQRKLAAQFPDSSTLEWAVADTLDRLGEYASAAESYLRAGSLAATPGDKAMALFAAGQARREAGNGADNADLARQIEALIDPRKPDVELIWKAAQLWKDAGDLDRFFAMAELVLILEPARTEERFSVAYAYGEHKRNALALHHYQSLLKAEPTNATAWNNLGAAASALKLPAQANEAFEKARELKSTIATANLAHELIDIGHLKAAQALCDEVANAFKDEERLLSAQSRIQSMPTEEADRAEKLVRETRVVRDFKQAWARAYLEGPSALTTLRFEAEVSQGALSVTATIQDGVIRGSATILVPMATNALGLGDRLISPPAPEQRQYRVQGFFQGRAGRIELQLVSGGKPSGGLLGSLLDLANHSFLLWSAADRKLTLAEVPVTDKRDIVTSALMS